MLKNLQTLIKIAQFELDEKRRELSEIQNKKDNLLAEIDNLDLEMQKEIKHAEQNLESKSFLQSYINGVKEKKDDLYKEAQKLSPKINNLMSQVSEKFTEVKKYENVLENKIEKIKYESRKKSQIEIDEIALLKHNSQN